MSEMKVLTLDPQATVIRLASRLYFVYPILMPGATEPLSVRFVRDDGESVMIVPGEIPLPHKPCRLCPPKQKGCDHADAVVALGLMRGASTQQKKAV